MRACWVAGRWPFNEALAFSSIDIEVAGFVIWEATSGRKFLLSLRPPHSRQACERGCASQTTVGVPMKEPAWLTTEVASFVSSWSVCFHGVHPPRRGASPRTSSRSENRPFRRSKRSYILRPRSPSFSPSPSRSCSAAFW